MLFCWFEIDYFWNGLHFHVSLDLSKIMDLWRCRQYYKDLLDFLKCRCSKGLHQWLVCCVWKPGDSKCLLINGQLPWDDSYLLDTHQRLIVCNHHSPRLEPWCLNDCIFVSVRMLQDHNGVQPRPDGCAVCGLLHSSVSAHWRQSTSHRGSVVS